MRKIAHLTWMNNYLVVPDALILAWAFTYTYTIFCVYEQWVLWKYCAQAHASMFNGWSNIKYI